MPPDDISECHIKLKKVMVLKLNLEGHHSSFCNILLNVHLLLVRHNPTENRVRKAITTEVYQDVLNNNILILKILIVSNVMGSKVKRSRLTFGS